MSTTFYKQLLQTHIISALKRQSSHQCLFALLGSGLVKAAIKMLVKLTPAVFFEPNDAVDENRTKEDAKK